METDEPALVTDDQPAPPPPGEGKHDPERRCIVTGVHGPREEFVRLALGPDGSVAPDVRAKAGGRGAWIGCDRATLEQAIAKGKFRGALARAFKGQPFGVPEDLPARIEAALERAALDRLGLEARAGTLVTGSDRILEQLRRGTVSLLLHAADAGADGTRKLDQALRVGLEKQGEDGVRGLALPVGRTILSIALGRENVVHIALLAPAAAARVSHALRRWRGFIGLDGSARQADGGAP